MAKFGGFKGGENKMRVWLNVKSKAVISIIISFLLLLNSITLIAAGVDTIVYVDPSNQVVAPGSNFSINISCIPGQPIKSFELKVSFNATLLQANNVSEGNIFSGYSTFFNAGIINNTAGTIINVYGLIMGAGNVSTPGTLVIINFTANQISGISSLNLYDVGVTNESEYVPLVVNNGSAQVDGMSPELTDNSSLIGYTGDSYTYNVSVVDNTCSADNLTVQVDWSHGALNGNETMVHAGGSYFEKTVVLDLNSTANMTYLYYAADLYGNSKTTSITSVVVQDNDPPQISNVTALPSIQEIGAHVNVSVTVIDNILANEIYLNITDPNSVVQNISITLNKTGNMYFCNNTYNEIGTYSYFIWANDTSGFSSISTVESFVIGDTTLPEIKNVALTTSLPLDTDPAFGWINITSDVTDNVAVNHVVLNITTPSGSFNNVSMVAGTATNYYYNSNVTFSQYGNYSYFIWANDSSKNSNSSMNYIFSMPPNWDIDKNGECKVFDLILVSNHYGETGSQGWIREDVDNNGEIQIIDLVLVSNHYNESWWM